jgi:hypothetical protein
MLATEVVDLPSTSPSTTVATPAILVTGRRRQTKERQSRKHETRRRSIDWKVVDSVFEPLHARFDFTLKGCADDEGLNSHGDYNTVRRVTRFLRGTCYENNKNKNKNKCLLIHPGSWLNILDSILKLVVEHLRHLRWLFLCYQSGQNSLNSLSTRNSTKNSQTADTTFYSPVTREPNVIGGGCTNSLACTTVVSRRRLCFLRSGFA